MPEGYSVEKLGNLEMIHHRHVRLSLPTSLADTWTMTKAGKVAEAVEEPDEREHERELHKMWRPMDVFCAVVLTVVVCTALWIGVSSGYDYVHVGRSACVFAHDRYSHMDLKCGTDPVGNSGVPSGNSGVPLTNTGASISNPTGLP